jgi:hypothetical protein
VCTSQALSLYTREFDGSKAIIAAKIGGVKLTVFPISAYQGKADAAKVKEGWPTVHRTKIVELM